MKHKTTLDIEFIDHTHVMLSNNHGDTIKFKSENVQDFFQRAIEKVNSEPEESEESKTAQKAIDIVSFFILMIGLKNKGSLN